MTATETMINFLCGGCGRPFSVPPSFVGRRASCKQCGTKVVVPPLMEDTGAESEASAGGMHAPPWPQPKGRKGPATPANIARPAFQPLRDKTEDSASSPPSVARLAVPSRSAGANVVSRQADMPTSDPAQPLRRTSQIPIVSEAQSIPITAALAPAAESDARITRALQNKPLIELLNRPSTPSTSAPKVPVRIRRLRVDGEQMKAAYGTKTGPIHLKSAVGDPPELYQIDYEVSGLERGWFGKPRKRTSHRVEIQLTSEYPRVSPKCRMLTPVFHPNIDEATICVGDHWTAGERLVDLVARIGEMLAYQAYNIQSPLNGEAAMWADLNADKLPTDSRNFHPDTAG